MDQKVNECTNLTDTDIVRIRVQDTLRCVGAAIPVGLGYAVTTSQVKKLPKGGFREGEAMWRQRHRWAARRLCGLMTEFRE